MWKLSAAALSACVLGLLLRPKNAELSMLLGTATVTALLITALGQAGSMRSLADTARALLGRDELYTAAVLKCVAISIVTKLCAELCQDASQRSVAAAVELAGTLCAMGVSLPLILSVLKLVGSLI